MALNVLKSFSTIRRTEAPFAALMFAYYLLVITVFWILKPIKSTLFIRFYDKTGWEFLSLHLTAAQAEQIAKILNLFVAFAAVVVFTWLARRFRRQQLSYIFTGFFMLSFAAFSLTLNHPGTATVWSFYLFGDLFTTLMVTTFFAFLNDSVTPDRAKRLYGVIVLGGVLGGAIGPTVLRVWISRLPTAGWLWICIVLAAFIVLIAWRAGAIVQKLNAPGEESPRSDQKSPPGNAAVEGARLVFSSRYLLAVVAIVGLYEVCSQILDFQFKSSIAYYLDGEAIGRQFATVYAISNWVSLFVQLFLTTLIMTRVGVTVALLVLPAAISLGSAGFLVAPMLWTGSLLNTADSGFAYSINQSAKEALYVPTTTEQKYKAKAFIDMFVQRLGKVIPIVVSLAITSQMTDFSTVRWLSLLTLVTVSIWIFAALFAGRHFRRLAGEQDEGKAPVRTKAVSEPVG